MSILGLHHITLVSSDAQRTLDFYTALGLRLVKQAMNFHNPNSAHWYWAVGEGAPGAIPTYFERDPQKEPCARMGAGQIHHFQAPQAAERHWYPNRFSAPIPSNQPWLDSALASLEEISQAAVSAGIPVERQRVMSFSQGACLALEFVARSCQPYGGAAGLAGSLIGPLDTPREYPAGLEGMPVFLGCSDVDPFIPKEFVLHSASTLENLGTSVTTRFYPGLEHRINLDELRALASMMEKLL